jgi:hypothetical protein
MRNRLFLTLGTSALFGLIASLTVQASPASAADGNRLQARFSETTVLVNTGALAQYGVLQIINTGTGTVQGFGPATMVLSITQDHDVTPCGPGSSTNAAVRRITLAQGVLVEEELAIACPTPSGALMITGTYQVDGASSSGLFAGARGEGNFMADTSTGTSTLSGKLFLARSGE